MVLYIHLELDLLRRGVQRGHDCEDSFIMGGFTLSFAVTQGKTTPAILHGNGPLMPVASMLLKRCGACLRYQVHPPNYIFHNEERKANFLGSSRRIGFIESFNEPWVIKHHKNEETPKLM